MVIQKNWKRGKRSGKGGKINDQHDQHDHGRFQGPGRMGGTLVVGRCNPPNYMAPICLPGSTVHIAYEKRTNTTHIVSDCSGGTLNVKSKIDEKISYSSVQCGRGIQISNKL